MAKPPEPIEEVLPQATWVVEAEVAEVLSTGPKPPPPPNAKPGATSVGYKSAAQQVKLKVTNVLRGEATKELVVQKPEAGYLLEAGNKGPFLIDAEKNILGRYGPDSWSLERVKQHLSR
jgi:hypothetical protein